MIARSAVEGGGEFPTEATTATVDNVSARFITLFPRAVHYYLSFFFSAFVLLFSLSDQTWKTPESVSTVTSGDRPNKYDYLEIKESALVPLASRASRPACRDSPRGLAERTRRGKRIDQGVRNSVVTRLKADGGKKWKAGGETEASSTVTK